MPDPVGRKKWHPTAKGRRAFEEEWEGSGDHMGEEFAESEWPVMELIVADPGSTKTQILRAMKKYWSLYKVTSLSLEETLQDLSRRGLIEGR